MSNLRYYFGVYVAGPIAGIGAYLLSPKPMAAALVAAYATTILATGGLLAIPFWGPFMVGALAHAIMGIKGTIDMINRNSEVIDKELKGNGDGYAYHYAVKGLREENAHGPIPNAILWGYSAANLASGLPVYTNRDTDRVELSLSGFGRTRI